MEQLHANSRATATLGVLVLILVIGVAWALHKVTEPFPGKADATPICEDTPVSAGDTIQTGQVLVNVLNAGDQAGLAQDVQADLTRFGFGEGERDNAPKTRHEVAAQVWTTEPKSPAVQLVASYLGKDVKILRKDSGYLGITVVVGDGFHKVKRGMSSITASGDTTVCEPTKVNDGIQS